MPIETQKKLEGGAFFELLKTTQEAIVLPPWVALSVRPRPGVWEYIKVNLNALVVEELQPCEYLHFKENLVNGRYVLNHIFTYIDLLCVYSTNVI